MTQYFIVYLGGDQPSSREGWIPIKNGYFRAEELWAGNSTKSYSRRL